MGHPDYDKKSKGPFTEYQQEKYSNARERNFRNTQFSHPDERETENVARFDLFDLNNKLRSEQPGRQSQGQSQGFQSQFRSQERSGREQMRYERISPFNNHQVPLLKDRTLKLKLL